MKRGYLYGFLAALFLTLLHVKPALCGEAVSSADGRKFCLINPPRAEKTTTGHKADIRAKTGPFSRVSSGRILTFFTGKMEKLGVGTPQCFFINAPPTVDPTAGIDEITEDPFERVEKRSFFPSVGYFKRSSVNSRQSIAIGVGLDRSSPSPESLEEGGAEGKVSLMVGFGF